MVDLTFPKPKGKEKYEPYRNLPSVQPNWGINSGNTNQITAPKIKPAQQDAIITIEDFFMTARTLTQ